jgi:hypothetical protein
MCDEGNVADKYQLFDLINDYIEQLQTAMEADDIHEATKEEFDELIIEACAHIIMGEKCGWSEEDTLELQKTAERLKDAFNSLDASRLPPCQL